MEAANEIEKLSKKIEDLEKIQCFLVVALIQCSGNPSTAIEMLKIAAAGDQQFGLSERGMLLIKDIAEVSERLYSNLGSGD